MVRTLDLANWAGRWIALDESDRVARDAETLENLMAILDTEGGRGRLDHVRARAGGTGAVRARLKLSPEKRTNPGTADIAAIEGRRHEGCRPWSVLGRNGVSKARTGLTEAQPHDGIDHEHTFVPYFVPYMGRH